MKKEIDTWKIERLIDVFKTSLLWFWYLFGILAGAALWFFPLPNTRIQTFAWAGAFVLFSVLSVAISKIEALKNEFK